MDAAGRLHHHEPAVKDFKRPAAGYWLYEGSLVAHVQAPIIQDWCNEHRDDDYQALVTRMVLELLDILQFREIWMMSHDVILFPIVLVIKKEKG